MTKCASFFNRLTQKNITNYNINTKLNPTSDKYLLITLNQRNINPSISFALKPHLKPVSIKIH